MILIAGGGIGGLATALSLHHAGIACAVYEQSAVIRELGVGINTLPHAIAWLDTLGLLPALDKAGIRTRELILANRFGQPVWTELRGTEAGHAAPQFSIHRGKLLQLLLDAVRQRGIEVHTAARLAAFEQSEHQVTARFTDGRTATGAALIGADGIHSVVRAALFAEGPPTWSGIMLWRGALEWPTYADGRTMLIAGGMRAKFVLYPIHDDPARPGLRLTNWVVQARTAEADAPPPAREDWSREGRLEDLLPFVRDTFQLDRLGFIDPLALIRASPAFYEYPMVDRDPLSRWTHGRVTLLGDAAHPMYPVGSNGASQAILDAKSLAHHLAHHLAQAESPAALQAYEAERRPATAEVVLLNRTGGPERVIDLIEHRAPHGFDNIDRIASHAERQAIVRGYAQTAGFGNRNEHVKPAS